MLLERILSIPSSKKIDDGIVGHFTYYVVSYGEYLWLTFSQLKEWII